MIGDPTEPVPAVPAEVARELPALIGLSPEARRTLGAAALAELAREVFLDGDPRGRRVTICAGAGEAGHIAAAAGRRLAAWGATVRVLRAGDAPPSDAGDVDLVVDGIAGLVYPLSDDEAALARWADHAPSPVLALQAPAGLDPDEGTPGEGTVHASATLALGLPTHAVIGPDAADHVGDLFVADLGAPREVYDAVGLSVETGALFATASVLRLR